MHNNHVRELVTAVQFLHSPGEAAGHPRNLRVDAGSGHGLFDGRSRAQDHRVPDHADRSVRCADFLVGRHWLAVVGAVVSRAVVGRGVVVVGASVPVACNTIFILISVDPLDFVELHVCPTVNLESFFKILDTNEIWM